MTFPKMAITIGGFTLLVFLFLFIFLNQGNVQNGANMQKNTRNISMSPAKEDKTCKTSDDCELLTCTGGCVNKKYAKELPPQPPCTTYDSYSCGCNSGVCTMLSPQKANANTPPIIDLFACGDYCPLPYDHYVKKVYEGVTTQGECDKYSGKFGSFTGWSTVYFCEVK